MRISKAFALAIALVAAVALVGPASATDPTAISFSDSLEGYTVGNLNGQTPWSGNGVSQTVVINTDHYGGTGTQCEKLMQNHVTGTTHSSVQRSVGVVGYPTSTGAWKLHWRMKFPDRATATGNMWYVYLENASNQDFATFYGGTANAQARWYWGGGSTPNYPITDGNWHDFDIVVDQTTQYIYWYVDGTLLKTVKNTITGASLPDHVRTYMYHRTDIATGLGVLIDDWAYGETNRPSWPTLVAPDGGAATYNYVGGLRPKIDWLDITDQDRYQIKINSTNTEGGTNVWDSGEVTSAISEGTVGMDLTPATTYYAFARVRTSTGGWGEWSPPSNGFTVTAQPVVYAPDAICGFNPQFRFFGPDQPIYKVEANPAPNGVRVKVFTTNSSNPEGDVAYWDSGDVSPTTSVAGDAGRQRVSVFHSTPALLDSDLGNPPTNKYYFFTKVRLGDSWGPWTPAGLDFVWDQTAATVPATPSAVTPSVFTTVMTDPVINWTAAGDWDQSQVLLWDTTADPDVIIHNTGWSTDAGPVTLTGVTLTNNYSYLVQVRVRKGCLGGAEGFPSEYGSSTFVAYSGPPDPPIVDAPTDPHQGLMPVVLFHGDPHTQLQAKITSDAAGLTIVWDSLETSSTAFGANSDFALSVGPLYYAFARIGNPLGWSAWSASSSFHVSQSNEATDIRHMDEAGLITVRTTAPNDMFLGGMPPAFVGTGCAMSQPACAPGLLRITDVGAGGMFRKHNSYISFDKGTTVVAAVRTWIGDGSDVDEDWKAGTILVTDSENHCGASIKVRPDQIGICVNGTTWPDTVALTPSTDFRVIRITAKAATYNDPSSIEWKVYVDETLQLTAYGAVSQSVFETGATGVGSWVTGQVCIGQGSYGIQGIFDFDWLAVNGSGAYAPGGWDQKLTHYVPAGSLSPRDWKLTGNAFADVTDAIKNGETGWGTITASNAVINHVGTIAYYVQDALTGAGSLKIDAVGNPADLGKALDDITGLLSSDGLVKVVKNSPVVNIASPQPDPALPYSALVSNIKSLGGSPCVTQLVDLGGPFVQNTGRLVKIFGTLPANPSDPADPVPGYLSGAQIFYVDDLSHPSWVLDGRDGELPGLRILLDLSYETAIWDPLTSTGIGLGALVQIEGVSSLDDYITGGVIKTVRKIADPVITQIPK